jgi:ubiquinone biosynthesis protein COQ9
MPEHALPADPTLDEVRVALSPVIGRHAGFDGWSDAAVHAAADDMGIDRDVAMLAFNGKAIDMIDAWIEGVDLELARRLPADKLGAMKIRDRITGDSAGDYGARSGIAPPRPCNHGDAPEFS